MKSTRLIREVVSLRQENIELKKKIEKDFNNLILIARENIDYFDEMLKLQKETTSMTATNYTLTQKIKELEDDELKSLDLT